MVSSSLWFLIQARIDGCTLKDLCAVFFFSYGSDVILHRQYLHAVCGANYMSCRQRSAACVITCNLLLILHYVQQGSHLVLNVVVPQTSAGTYTNKNIWFVYTQPIKNSRLASARARKTRLFSARDECAWCLASGCSHYIIGCWLARAYSVTTRKWPFTASYNIQSLAPMAHLSSGEPSRWMNGWMEYGWMRDRSREREREDKIL